MGISMSKVGQSNRMHCIFHNLNKVCVCELDSVLLLHSLKCALKPYSHTCKADATASEISMRSLIFFWREVSNESQCETP